MVYNKNLNKNANKVDVVTKELELLVVTLLLLLRSSFYTTYPVILIFKALQKNFCLLRED